MFPNRTGKAEIKKSKVKQKKIDPKQCPLAEARMQNSGAPLLTHFLSSHWASASAGRPGREAEGQSGWLPRFFPHPTEPALPALQFEKQLYPPQLFSES